MKSNDTTDATSILIFEDDYISGYALMLILEGKGIRVKGVFSNADEIVALYEQHQPDMILMDINLEGKMDGISAAKKLVKFYQIPFLFISAYNYSSQDSLKNSFKKVAFARKPYNDREIHEGIASLV